MENRHISFFKPCLLHRKGIIIDDEAMASITDSDLAFFSESELEFVEWYQQKKEKGLFSCSFSGHPEKELTGKPLLEIDQESLCKDIMIMVHAADAPDAEVLGEFSI